MIVQSKQLVASAVAPLSAKPNIAITDWSLGTHVQDGTKVMVLYGTVTNHPQYGPGYTGYVRTSKIVSIKFKEGNGDAVSIANIHQIETLESIYTLGNIQQAFNEWLKINKIHNVVQMIVLSMLPLKTGNTDAVDLNKTTEMLQQK